MFSISQLAKFSGIKAHTIRMWEQRYNALSPNRSEGNTRYYDNSQLRRLLNIVSLMEADHKVSELCSMPDKNLYKLLSDIQNKKSISETTDYFVSQLIAAGMSYDEQHFEKTFSHCLLRFGIKDVYIKIIYPMLLRIGLMWASDTMPTAHEHFISNLIRQKLFTAIDSLPAAKKNDDKWLLFLPENEFHEMGLLFSDYLIRYSGRKVIYLGSNVPLQSVINAIKDFRPAHVLLFLVHGDLTHTVQQYCEQLCSNFTGKKVYVAGNNKLINELRPNKKLALLLSVETLERELSYV